MTADYSVKVENVTVAYRIYKERATSLKESAMRFIKGRKSSSYEDFFALKNVSLKVEKGRVLGIIGSNGSGKSTLLKVMTQVLPPTSGMVQMQGKYSSLVELGVGFDPELTATENIYLHGSLYKKTKRQIEKRIDHIIEFADLQDFRNTRLKYFSSGMIARLGFSAAIDIDPEILIVDEVLAVGDVRFQEKCRAVFNNFFSSGRTVIIVSHDLKMLEKHCSEIALLSCGEVIFKGDPSEALKRYKDPGYHTRLG